MQLQKFSFIFLISIICIAEPPKPRPDEKTKDGYTKQQELDLLTGRKRDVHKSYSQKVIETCLKGKTLSNLQIANILKHKSNITIEHPNTVPKDLMLYLIAYFDVLNYRFSRPMPLKVEGEGPTLVKVQNGTLIFAKNSVEGLFTKELVQKIGELKNRPAEKEIKFKNTLFEQLTLVIENKNEGFVFNIVKQQFGILLYEKEQFLPGAKPLIFKTPDGGEIYQQRYIPAEEHSASETVAILKQLIDLPKFITETMKLKAILRAPRGYKHREGAWAIYHPRSERIWIFDQAFAEDRLLGKFTVTHEIAHAVFEGLDPRLKKKFVELSWKRIDGKEEFSNNPYDYEIKDEFRDGKVGFITEYSRKNYDEDFAEHFAAYVNRPEELFIRYRKKYKFMEEHLFPESRYGSIAHKKFGTQSDYQREDIVAPSFGNSDFKGSLKDYIELKALKTTKEHLLIQCTVQGIKDGNKNINRDEFEVTLKIEDDKRENFSCYLRLCSADYDSKKDRYRKTLEIPLSELGKGGGIFVHSVYLSDGHNNRTYYPKKELTYLKKSGHNSLKPRPKYHPLGERIDQITITPIESSKERAEPAFKIKLPISVTDDLEDVDLYWVNNKDLAFTHTIERTHFQKSIDGKSISFIVHFSAHMPHQKLSLSEVQLNFKETLKWERGFYSAYIKKKNRPAVFVKSSSPNLEEIKIQANAIKTEIEKSDRTKKNTLKLTIPVKGLKGTDERLFKVRVRLIQPEDKEVKADHTGYASKPGIFDGKNFIMSVDLPEYKGKYIIEYISVTKYFPKTEQKGSIAPSFQHSKEDYIEIKETEVNRTFHISP